MPMSKYADRMSLSLSVTALSMAEFCDVTSAVVNAMSAKP